VYTNNSTGDAFPKTILIRNHEGGMIWQVYHVHSINEADNLTRNATLNGFFAISLENHLPEEKETWPDWRDNCTFAEPLP
jgi:hypothetical protein